MSDDGLEDFTAEIADQVRSFVIAVRETALGENPDQTVPLLLLEVSQLMLAGGRLGAIIDVVPDERFEPDAGPDPDVDGLRATLATLLGPIDEYAEVFDPYGPEPVVEISWLSDELVDVLGQYEELGFDELIIPDFTLGGTAEERFANYRLLQSEVISQL